MRNAQLTLYALLHGGGLFQTVVCLTQLFVLLLELLNLMATAEEDVAQGHQYNHDDGVEVVLGNLVGALGVLFGFYLRQLLAELQFACHAVERCFLQLHGGVGQFGVLVLQLQVGSLGFQLLLLKHALHQCHLLLLVGQSQVLGLVLRTAEVQLHGVFSGQPAGIVVVDGVTHAHIFPVVAVCLFVIAHDGINPGNIVQAVDGRLHLVGNLQGFLMVAIQQGVVQVEQFAVGVVVSYFGLGFLAFCPAAVELLAVRTVVVRMAEAFEAPGRQPVLCSGHRVGQHSVGTLLLLVLPTLIVVNLGQLQVGRSRALVGEEALQITDALQERFLRHVVHLHGVLHGGDGVGRAVEAELAVVLLGVGVYL